MSWWRSRKDYCKKRRTANLLSAKTASRTRSPAIAQYPTSTVRLNFSFTSTAAAKESYRSITFAKTYAPFLLSGSSRENRAGGSAAHARAGPVRSSHSPGLILFRHTAADVHGRPGQQFLIQKTDLKPASQGPSRPTYKAEQARGGKQIGRAHV